jgi:hypothetical protein
MPRFGPSLYLSVRTNDLPVFAHLIRCTDDIGLVSTLRIVQVWAVLHSGQLWRKRFMVCPLDCGACMTNCTENLCRSPHYRLVNYLTPVDWSRDRTGASVHLATTKSIECLSMMAVMLDHGTLRGVSAKPTSLALGYGSLCLCHQCVCNSLSLYWTLSPRRCGAYDNDAMSSALTSVLLCARRLFQASVTAYVSTLCTSLPLDFRPVSAPSPPRPPQW